MTEEEIDLQRFVWNDKLTPDQIERMNCLRHSGKGLCELFFSIVPKSADRSAAVRYLRLAIAQCNMAIAHEGLK